MPADDHSQSSPQELAANTTDKATLFWEKYSREADRQDQSFHEKNANNIDGVMLFAGLFSAVAAGFLAAMMGSLQPSPADTTNALLMMLVHSVNNTAFADQDLGLPVWNGPSTAILWSQALGYAALSASLLTALGSVLGKQWLSDFTEVHSGPLQERSRRRQQKLDGLKAWRIDFFMGALPTLIQLALLLFSISLSLFLWELNHAVGAVLIAATAIGVFFYSFFTLASLISPTCPFHTPVSSTIYGAIGTVMKMVAYTTAVLFSPLVAIASAILLTVLAIYSPLAVSAAWVRGRGALVQSRMNSYRSALQFRSLKRRLHLFLCSLRDSAHNTRHNMRRVYLDPVPNPDQSDPRSIAWLLETSTDPDSLMVAAESVPDVKWPTDLDISVPTEHLYSLFVRSIPERGPTNDRALRLGKAFIVMLCHVSKEVGAHVWKPALLRVQKEARAMKFDADSDLLFVLPVVAKLVSHKLGSTDLVVEFPRACDVSQPLLIWLLQPLEVLLQLENPNPSRFLPEAYRTFLRLDWPEESKTEGVQYCKTFEVYFNSVVGASAEEIDIIDEEALEDQLQTERLKRVLEKLKQVDISQVSDKHHHLLVPLTVLSKLASIPNLKQTFKDSVINSWTIEAFKEAIRRANESGENIWLFASCLMNLATAVEAFGPIDTQDGYAQRAVNGGALTQKSPPRVDSKTLISYLINSANLATTSSEQTVYALNIVYANMDQLHELSSDPDFINYIVSATGPKQVYSIRDIGLKVLVASCDHLLHLYDTQRLVELAAHCDLARFLHRAFLHQDPPAILTDLLRNNNEDFNANLLRILARALGNPFNTLLTKLRDQPHKIPERDLRDLEIALVLSTNDGRKKHLFDHLDSSITQMQHKDYRDPLALPLTVMVGWLLRTNAPLSTSEDIWKAFIRPRFEELLYPAWGEPDKLEENPQMLRLLLDCTARWLSIYLGSGASSSSDSTASLTLRQLQRALEELKSESRALPYGIRKSVQRFSDEISELV